MQWSIDSDTHKFQPIRDSAYCFFCERKKDDPIHDTSSITLNEFKEKVTGEKETG